MAWILPVISIAAAAGGTGVSAVGQLKAGSAAKVAAEANAQDILATALANAQNAEYEAANVLEATRLSEKQQRYIDTLTISRGRAISGASGVVASQGSPLDVLAENTRQAEIKALEIRRGGQIQLDAIRRQQQQEIERAARQAAVARAGGQAQATASTYGAAGTVLGGSYSIGKDIIDLQRSKN